MAFLVGYSAVTFIEVAQLCLENSVHAGTENSLTASQGWPVGPSGRRASANGQRDALNVDEPTSTTTWSAQRGWSLRITVNAPQSAADPTTLSGLTAESSTDGSNLTALM